GPVGRAPELDGRGALHQRPVEIEEGGRAPAGAGDGSVQLPFPSTSTASPWPPPEQIAAQPSPPPRRRSSSTSEPRIRAPEAPIGCPSATAPPLTLTRPESILSILIEFRVTEAKASLISQRSMSSAFSPTLASAFSAALAGVLAR